LKLALEGSVDQHQRFMIEHLLGHIEFLESRIEEIGMALSSRWAISGGHPGTQAGTRGRVSAPLARYRMRAVSRARDLGLI